LGEWIDLLYAAPTRLVESGADIGLVQLILGHGDLKITQRYVHPSKVSALQAVEEMAQRDEIGAEMIENEAGTIN
jgi:site-specific recombinase XerD